MKQNPISKEDLQAIRDKLLKNRNDKDTYVEGVLDFYIELRRLDEESDNK